MKIVLGLGPIDYANTAKALLPLLKAKDEDSLSSRLIAAAAKLPEEPLTQLINSLSRKELDGILRCLAAEKEEKLLELGNRLLERQELPVCLSAFSLSEDMELSITAGDIDYAALARRFLPLVPEAVLDEHPATRALALLMKLPAKLLYSALESLPREKPEQAIMWLAARYESAIIEKLKAIAAAKGIELPLLRVRVER